MLAADPRGDAKTVELGSERILFGALPNARNAAGGLYLRKATEIRGSGNRTPRPNPGGRRWHAPAEGDGKSSAKAATWQKRGTMGSDLLRQARSGSALKESAERFRGPHTPHTL